LPVAPCLAEELVMALLVQMIRKGLVDEDDIEAMVQGLSDEAGHMASCAIVEAAAPQASEWKADQARARFHVVKGDEA